MELQDLILKALTDFELSINEIQQKFRVNSAPLIKTERVEHLKDDQITAGGES